MIRAQRETVAGSVQILGMVIGEVGMQIRHMYSGCDEVRGEVKDERERESRTNILTRVSDRVSRI